MSCTLTGLPLEILEKILLSDVLLASDILSCMKVCKVLSGLARSSRVWKSKFCKRYPLVGISSVGSANGSHLDGQEGWLYLFKERVLCGRKVDEELTRLASLCYKMRAVSDDKFGAFRDLMAARPHGDKFTVDQLYEILKSPREDVLTEKFYALKVLRFVQQRLISDPVSEIVQSGDRRLESVAYYLSQWFQPGKDFREEYLVAKLDEWAWAVQAELRKSVSSHPVVKLEALFTEDISETKWTAEEGYQIVCSVHKYLCETAKITGDKLNYYDCKNSYIDSVVSTGKGIPITLAIIFSAVARRLGVLCDPVNYPSHFLLRYLRFPLVVSSTDRYMFIDAFNGKIMTWSDVGSLFIQHGPNQAPDLELGSLDAASTKTIMKRVLRNLSLAQSGDDGRQMISVLEFTLLLEPNHIESIIKLSRLYLMYDINISYVMVLSQRLNHFEAPLVDYLQLAARNRLSEQAAASGSGEEKKVFKRSDEKHSHVQYAVGMILQHRRYDYMCVVESWTSTCVASDEWMQQMGVSQLPHQGLQPFYCVLCDDNSERYAAQENLKHPTATSAVAHPDIGKHFCSFENHFYKPNEHKQSEYPEDYQYTMEKAQQLYSPKENTASAEQRGTEHGDG